MDAMPLDTPAAPPAAPASRWPSEITVDGVALRLVVVERRIRNYYARLDEDTVSVKVPLRADPEQAREAIFGLARRLLRRRVRTRAEAEVDLLALAHRVAARFPERPRVASAEFSSTQISWWGRYHPARGHMEIAAVLRHMPPWVLESVVAHELAHAFHHRHGRGFHDLLRRACPEAEQAMAFLRGVAWFARSFEALPPVERALLLRAPAGTRPFHGTGP